MDTKKINKKFEEIANKLIKDGHEYFIWDNIPYKTKQEIIDEYETNFKDL